MVVNIDSTVQAIRAAIDQAETMAGVRDRHGLRRHRRQPRARHEQGRRRRDRRRARSTDADVERVLEQSKAIPLPSDRQVLHVLPQEYIVDDQDGIAKPVGMSGVRLEARVHLVTAATASVQNIIKCAERCNLHVAEVVLEPLASAAGRALARTSARSASR